MVGLCIGPCGGPSWGGVLFLMSEVEVWTGRRHPAGLSRRLRVEFAHEGSHRKRGYLHGRWE